MLLVDGFPKYEGFVKVTLAVALPAVTVPIIGLVG
jgi:hypothetical protein